MLLSQLETNIIILFSNTCMAMKLLTTLKDFSLSLSLSHIVLEKA